VVNAKLGQMLHAVGAGCLALAGILAEVNIREVGTGAHYCYST